MKTSSWPDAADRAFRSGGESQTANYAMVADALRRSGVTTGRLLDIGCGSGNLYPFVRDRLSSYVGVDLVRYDGFPAAAEWVEANLDELPLPLAAGCADVVAAVETIEHLENPRAFMRELVRLAKPGGTVVVTTPNQLSLLSKMTLMLKKQIRRFSRCALSGPYHRAARNRLDQNCDRVRTSRPLDFLQQQRANRLYLGSLSARDFRTVATDDVRQYLPMRHQRVRTWFSWTG